MSKIIKTDKFILSDIKENSNKFWEIELWDCGDVITRYGRVGYGSQQADFPSAGQSFYDKKIREKTKKGYSYSRSRCANHEASAARGALPNVRSRGCSSDLKTRIIKRWLKSIGVETYEDYVGIRSDEAHRKLEILAQMPKYITGKFPLCDDGTTKEIVNNWWDAHPFRLNIPNHQGNCDMCFLKAKWKRLSIAQREPQHAQWWADWERKMRERGVTGRGAQWIDGKSYEGIIAESQHPEFDFTEQDVPCSCAVSGYRDASDEGHNEKADR